MHNIAMNKLSPERRAQVISALVEGNSIRATCRMTGTAKGTVLKLLADVGEVCRDYQDKHVRKLTTRRIQCDEIWSFCYAKEKNVPKEHRGEFGYGDVYTWTAMCADTKIVPSFLVGRRDSEHAKVFIKDLASRLKTRIQLTTDGHKVYLDAIEDAFGGDIDYAMLVKIYELTPTEDQRKYSPVECMGAEIKRISGNPVKEYVSTSFVERQNLTMRMSMRRFTRLTNGFSKKVENLFYAIALHFMYYNFGRIHKTLRVTPAMEAGIADHVWTLGELVNLL